MNNTVFKINKFNGKSLVINDLNNYLNSSNEYKVKDIERLLSSYGYSNEFYKTSSKACKIKTSYIKVDNVYPNNEMSSLKAQFAFLSKSDFQMYIEYIKYKEKIYLDLTTISLNIAEFFAEQNNPFFINALKTRKNLGTFRNYVFDWVKFLNIPNIIEEKNLTFRNLKYLFYWEDINKFFGQIESFLETNQIEFSLFHPLQFTNYFLNKKEASNLKNENILKTEKESNKKYFSTIVKELKNQDNHFLTIDRIENYCNYLNLTIREDFDLNRRKNFSRKYISNEDFLSLKNFVENTPVLKIKDLVTKNTHLKKRGVINNSCTQEWRDQVKEKSLKDWGTEWPSQSKEFKEKVIASNKEKYGVDSPNSLFGKIEKQKDTWNKKYKDPNSKGYQELRKKRKETSLRIYGTENSSQNINVIEKNKKSRLLGIEKNKQELIKNLSLKENLYSIKEVAIELNRKDLGTIRKEIRQLGFNLIKGKIYYVTESTFNLYKKIKNQISLSRGEALISYLLVKKGLKKDEDFYTQKWFPRCRDILPLPFDFYLPNYNVAIEYQGEQHFKPVYYYGKNKVDKEKAEQYFLKVQKHDKIKREFCEQSDIILLTPDYTMSYKEIEELILDTLGIETN